MHVHVHSYLHATEIVWKSEESIDLQEPTLLPPCGSLHGTLVVRLGHGCLYLLSHLNGLSGLLCKIFLM